MRRNNTSLRARKAPSSLSSFQKKEVSTIVKRTVNRDSEHKYFLPGTTLAVTATWQYQSILAIPQGDSDSDRDGDSVHLLGNMEIQYSIEKNAASTIPADHFRIVVFQWFQNSVTSVPSDATLWLNDPAVGAVNYRSMESHDFGQQGKAPVFRILYDRVHTIAGLPAVPTTSMTQFIRRQVSLNNIRRNIQFSAGTVNGTNILFLAWISTTATAPLAVNFSARFQYTDH